MKNIKKLFLIIFSFIISNILFIPQTNGKDILGDVFDDVKNYGAMEIINLGDTSQDVGHNFLRQSTSRSSGSGFYQKEPVIVRVTKLLLKITIVLSVTMIIYNSIKFMIQVFKAKSLKSAEAKKDLINVLIGLIVALSSVIIINFVISAGKTIVETAFYKNILINLFI